MKIDHVRYVRLPFSCCNMKGDSSRYAVIQSALLSLISPLQTHHQIEVLIHLCFVFIVILPKNPLVTTFSWSNFFYSKNALASYFSSNWIGMLIAGCVSNLTDSKQLIFFLFEECIKKYSKRRHKFDGLDAFFESLDEELKNEYLKSTIPYMAKLALEAPAFITQVCCCP